MIWAGILEMEQGACWFQQDGPFVKVAAFNEKVSLEFHRSYLLEDAKQNGAGLIVSAHLFCSSSFVSIHIRGEKENGGLRCFHYFLENKSETPEFKLEGSYPDSPDATGMCLGHSESTIIAGKKLSSDDKNYLLGNYPQILDIESSFIELKSGVDATRMLEILEKDSELDHIKFEFDQIIFPVGTSLIIKTN